MPYQRTAVFWFLALLVILVTGFWKTYFSVMFQGMERAHHFHGLAMLAWVLLLINQAWLVRARRFDIHRQTGKISWVLAPLIVVSGFVVTFFNVGRVSDPMSPFTLSIFWFGLFSTVTFGLFYALAMYHRRDVQRHARYMVTTALVFLVPGLFRTLYNFLEPLGVPLPSFYQITWMPGLIGLALLAADWRAGRVYTPFLVFTVLWAVHLVLWPLLPHMAFWRDFTTWSASVAGGG